MPEMMSTIVAREYHVWYKTGDPDLLRFLLTFLMFGKKLDYADDELHAIAFREWLGIEERLSVQQLPGLEILSNITRQLVPNLQDMPFVPKFGTGAISEDGVRGVQAKWNSLGLNKRLRFGMHRLQDGTAYPESYDHWFGLETPDSDRGSTGTSKLMFVPKDIRKARSICMEPNSGMFVQQHVRKAYEDVLHRRLLGFIDLRDQGRNQTLAEIGSLTNMIDTLDLSSASDSMDVRIVKELFPPKVSQVLMATRSSRVITPEGDERVLFKFAPMGSALCFPVQTTVFTASVILAYMLVSSEDDQAVADLAKVRHWSLDVQRFLRRRVYRDYTGFSDKLQPFTVYGDDIICDAKATDYVIRILQHLGFKVNVEKSFTGRDGYRESCGKHYVGGYECTPILFTVKRYSGKISPSSYMSLVGMINKAGDVGYRRTQSYLINHLKKLARRQNLRPFFTEDSTDTSGIFSKNVHRVVLNKSTRRYVRHSRLYTREVAESNQLLEMKVSVPVIDERQQHADTEGYGFAIWMRRAYLGSDSDDFASSFPRYDPVRTRWGWRWIPSP